MCFRYFCRENASEAAPTPDSDTAGRCTAGHYCPEGTADPIPCADGTYMEDRQAAECLECPPGRYCVTGLTPQPCPRGFFCQSGMNAEQHLSSSFFYKLCLNDAHT